MANTRRTPSGTQKPQLDYYEYKRQREERLRRRAAAEGRVWEPPVVPVEEPAEEQYDDAPVEEGAQEEYEPQESGVRSAFGKLGALGTRLKSAVIKPRADEEYDEYADAPEDAPAQEDAQDAPVQAPDSQPQPEEAADLPGEEPVDIDENSAQPEEIIEDAQEVFEEPADAQEYAEEYADEYADEDGYASEEGEYDEYAEEEADGNEDNPFSAFLHVARKAGGQAKTLFGGLKEKIAARRGATEDADEEVAEEEYESETCEAPEGEENAVFAVENAPEETFTSQEESLQPEDAPQDDAADIADVEDVADAADVADATDSAAPTEEQAGTVVRPSLFMDEDEYADGEEEEEPKAGFGAKLKDLFAAVKQSVGRKKQAEEEPEWDEEPAPVSLEQEDGQATNIAAADMPAAEEESVMNEQENRQPNLSEQLARELDSAPVLSRRERKALAAAQAAAARAAEEEAVQSENKQPAEEPAAEEIPAASVFEGVDEPTMEFTPVRARGIAPAQEEDEEDEDEEKEEPKPVKRGLFGRKKKPVVEEEEDDEDDEDDYDDEDDEEIIPRRGRKASRFSRRDEEEDEEEYDEDDDWDEEDEDEEPRRRSGRSRYDDEDEDDDYDDEDDYDDDYDDDDYDDEEDAPHSGFGWGLLRFIRGLLILVIIGALLVLGLREMETRGMLSLDAVRAIEFGGITETLFPAPEQGDADGAIQEEPEDGQAEDTDDLFVEEDPTLTEEEQSAEDSAGEQGAESETQEDTGSVG